MSRRGRWSREREPKIEIESDVEQPGAEEVRYGTRTIIDYLGRTKTIKVRLPRRKK